MPQVSVGTVTEQLRRTVDAQHKVTEAARAAAERVPVVPVPEVTPEPAPPAPEGT